MKNTIAFSTLFCIGLAASINAAPLYISFRWSGGPIPVRAYQSDGTTSLPAGSTLLTFLSQDSTITWSPNWSDGSDGGNYGASGNDTFLQAISCGPAGAYNTANITENPTTHGNWYAYFVLVDYSYASFAGTLPDNANYAVLGSTYQVTAYDQATQPGLFQTFAPGETLTTSGNISVVPEPTTLALLASGLGVVLVRRRKKQSV